jgi:hypothetical protein
MVKRSRRDRIAPDVIIFALPIEFASLRCGSPVLGSGLKTTRRRPYLWKNVMKRSYDVTKRPGM